MAITGQIENEEFERAQRLIEDYKIFKTADPQNTLYRGERITLFDIFRRERR